jgi:hypothetical protein
LPDTIVSGAQRFFPHRAQVDQVCGVTQIFLGDLHFHHQRRLRHRAEQRRERFARLEIDGPVLHLHEHVFGELAIERHEFRIRLLGAVLGVLARIDERAPHDDAAVRRERPGQHVGAVGVGAPVVLRPGLALGVGLDEEAAEVGDVVVDLVDLRLPPGAHGGIERIGGLESAQLDGRAEARGQVHAHPVGAKDCRQSRGFSR